MLKRKATKAVSDQIIRICEEMGSPSDLRVMSVGKEGLSHLLYLNSLADEETVALVTNQINEYEPVPPGDHVLPVAGRVGALDGPVGAVEWIRDPSLKVEELRVGRRTKTRIALVYSISPM